MMRASTRAKRTKYGADDPAYWDHDLLTADQERALARKAQAGDLAARNELILKNQRLVVCVAKQGYRKGHLSLSDLVSIGNQGLIRAVEKYQPDRGVRFSTYATRWVRAMIRRGMFNTEWIIRVPEWAIVLSHRYRRLARKARNATGFEPAFEEVCAAMNLKEDKRACLRQALLVFSTEFHPKGEGLLAKESEAEPDLEREQDRQEKVEQLISRLTPKQANVIRLHYGFASPEGRSISLSDIGRAEGRQFQAIQQIRNRAIKTLRQIAGDDLRRLA